MLKQLTGKYNVVCARDVKEWKLGFGKRPALRDDILIDGSLYTVIQVSGKNIYVANLRRKVTIPVEV